MSPAGRVREQERRWWPAFATLRQDLNAAGLSGLDARVSLVPASYKPLPE
jgi:hypothetical protein